MIDYQVDKFSERFTHALKVAKETKPDGGICGFELEWNLLNSKLVPLLTIGAGNNRLSFIDYLYNKSVPDFLQDQIQHEVFHWMLEWATKPHYSFQAAVFESRLAEAVLINILRKIGNSFGERLYYWHGNLLSNISVGHDLIPNSWHLAKRRYLEKCVDLFGDSLATAGIHTNLSLPEPLLSWDFVHLPSPNYANFINAPLHLDDYKNQTYIRSTRLFRAYAAVFIATSSSTPFKPALINGKQTVVLSDFDSVRNLTFPNPGNLDVSNLYRSYEDYLNISYDLVSRGTRFGNNNWTPIRARSFSEPVERIIAITSEQLDEIYTRRLYSDDQIKNVEELAKQIEIQNLLARINIPMARVEIRTDEGGHPLELDIANLTLKYLLLLRFYSDQKYSSSFRYDAEDIDRARRNELRAAKFGLNAEIENPLTGKPIKMRNFISLIISDMMPLAQCLGWWDNLAPLIEISEGAPNTSELIRSRLLPLLGESREVPIDMLVMLAEERENQITSDINCLIHENEFTENDEKNVFDLLKKLRNEYQQDQEAIIRFNTRFEHSLEINNSDKTSEIISLSKALIKIQSVTACVDERLDEVRKAASMILDYSTSFGLNVQSLNKSKYPALLIGFPGGEFSPVMLSGHFDVVAPDPDDSQFNPYIDGDYLWGRGAADMKTVVATYLVWFKDMLKIGPPYPPINLLLVGNEENGEIEPTGSPHALKYLLEKHGYQPDIFIAGERTGEKGDELFGHICTENRGLIRLNIISRNQKMHSGVSNADKIAETIADKLFSARNHISEKSKVYLSLSGVDTWRTQISFPFLRIGEEGIYNITPGEGILGVEVRPIPEDNISSFLAEIENYCSKSGLDIEIISCEAGISCDPDNYYVQKLINAVKIESNSDPVINRKLPGTSARFAPGGQGVVWGQSGVGPHAANEGHFIPSIIPYFNALTRYGSLLNLNDKVEIFGK